MGAHPESHNRALFARNVGKDGLMSLTATHQRRRGSLIAEISPRRVADIAREATAWIKLMHALVDSVPD